MFRIGDTVKYSLDGAIGIVTEAAERWSTVRFLGGEQVIQNRLLKVQFRCPYCNYICDYSELGGEFDCPYCGDN